MGVQQRLHDNARISRDFTSSISKRGAMTLRAVLIAHAPTAATASAAFPQDEKLDERGRMKAAALAGHMRYGGRIYFAPERRTRETAAALGLAGGVEVALGECAYGLWAGRSIAGLHTKDSQALAAWLSDPLFRPPGGESIAELVSRIAAWLDLQARGEGRLIAVTHPAVLRAAALHAIGAPLEAFWRLAVAPLSELRITYEAGKWQLQSLGSLDSRATDAV